MCGSDIKKCDYVCIRRFGSGVWEDAGELGARNRFSRTG